MILFFFLHWLIDLAGIVMISSLHDVCDLKQCDDMKEDPS